MNLNHADDDFDIYGDLNFANDNKDDKHPKQHAQQSSNQSKIKIDDDQLFDELHAYSKLYTIENKLKQIMKENEKLINENNSLKKNLLIKDKQLNILKNNISSLYKTAKLELQRRTDEKQELQNRYDMLIFRRIQHQNKLSLVSDDDHSQENLKRKKFA